MLDLARCTYTHPRGSAQADTPVLLAYQLARLVELGELPAAEALAAMLQIVAHLDGEVDDVHTVIMEAAERLTNKKHTGDLYLDLQRWTEGG